MSPICVKLVKLKFRDKYGFIFWTQDLWTKEDNLHALQIEKPANGEILLCYLYLTNLLSNWLSSLILWEKILNIMKSIYRRLGLLGKKYSLLKGGKLCLCKSKIYHCRLLKMFHAMHQYLVILPAEKQKHPRISEDFVKSLQWLQLYSDMFRWSILKQDHFQKEIDIKEIIIGCVRIYYTRFTIITFTYLNSESFQHLVEIYTIIFMQKSTAIF